MIGLHEWLNREATKNIPDDDPVRNLEYSQYMILGVPLFEISKAKYEIWASISN